MGDVFLHLLPHLFMGEDWTWLGYISDVVGTFSHPRVRADVRCLLVFQAAVVDCLLLKATIQCAMFVVGTERHDVGTV